MSTPDMSDWTSIEFPLTIRKIKIGRKNQILASEIMSSGRYPVVDQGQGFIAGYTNADQKVICNDLPLVVFGDHTRCVKYVDFPFVLGADGTKVFKPNEDLFDPKFFYYALMNVKLPNRGYNRHFTLLTERSIPRPDMDEQRKIAAVLGMVQRAIEEQERLLRLTTELKKSFLHKLFTEGLRGEPQKMTEIGPVPESWEITELGRVVVLFGGYAFKSDESIPSSNTQLVRMGNLYHNKLDLTRSPIFYPEDFAQKYPRFVLKPGDLIMSLTGTSGKEDYGFTVEIGSIAKTLLLNQRIVRIDPISEQLSKDFLFYFLLSRQFLDHLYPTAKGMKQANLSTYAMKTLKIPMPTIDEQKEIPNVLRILDRRIDFHQKQSTIYASLFRTLLHQLMTAQIRVYNLDISEIEINCEEEMGT
ncbi:MAG: hypothetical protein C0392_02320 [Syntrophus sp. (in: bacteria)]|nr:hypothetical protein [Syntrophus sp. (in: bacteria)]